MKSESTAALSEAGVSIWLDDLSRGMLEKGVLQELILTKNVVGVTTNPSIFANAISSDDAYDAALEENKRHGSDAAQTITSIMVNDVKAACDALQAVFVASNGKDGRVSLEVEPQFAHDTEATVARAKELWKLVDRQNVMIKIPATPEGIPAITQVTAMGISVNVTLIFAISRYREVVSAYMYGLELALANGIDLSQIHSVASVFISRFDTEVAVAAGSIAQLEALTDKIGISNAKLIYEASTGLWSSERAIYLLGQNANEQRLLWASTGTKNPDFDKTLYVKELVAPNTVNTMPRETLEAVAEGIEFTSDAITVDTGAASLNLHVLSNSGLDYGELAKKLEVEGLQKFAESWNDLISSVETRLEQK